MSLMKLKETEELVYKEIEKKKQRQQSINPKLENTTIVTNNSYSMD